MRKNNVKNGNEREIQDTEKIVRIAIFIATPQEHIYVISFVMCMLHDLMIMAPCYLA